MMPVHPSLGLERQGRSAFRLVADGRPTTTVEPAGAGWDVAPQGWRLERRGGPQGTFRLTDGRSGAELGCSCSLGGAGQRRELRYFLLGDGRLFRLSLRGPASAGYALAGWETPGAYLEARNREGGWQILPTPACGGIDDVLVLAVLMGAEILDADDPLVCGERCESSR